MTRNGKPIAKRVASRDGDGPPLLLVHGGLGDHTRWGPLLPYLDPHFTVHAMDRRGRGVSGDGPDYSPLREFEDVAAVIDAIAADSILEGQAHSADFLAPQLVADHLLEFLRPQR